MGEKLIIEGYINDKTYKGLWDTGSMVSVINKHWIKSNFPNKKFFRVKNFWEPFGFENPEQY